MMYRILTGAGNLGRLNTVLPSPPNLVPKIEYNAAYVLIWSGCPLQSKYPTGAKFPANKETVPTRLFGTLILYLFMTF